MAIKRYAGDKFVGLSADIKPTNVPDGADFYETDTNKSFLKVSGVWTELFITESNISKLNLMGY